MGRTRWAVLLCALSAVEILAVLAVGCADHSSAPSPTGFRVTRVGTSVDSASFTGACPHTFTFTGTITASAPGTATYRWERSDSTAEATESLTFTAAGSEIKTKTWEVGTASSGWMRLHVLGPNDVTSNQAAFTLACTTTPFAVTAVSLSIDSASFSGTCPHKFTFTGSITANASGTVTYRWERSDGTPPGPTQSLAFANAGTQQVTDAWQLAASTSGWEQLRVLTPTALVSNQAAFALTCSK